MPVCEGSHLALAAFFAQSVLLTKIIKALTCKKMKTLVRLCEIIDSYLILNAKTCVLVNQTQITYSFPKIR